MRVMIALIVFFALAPLAQAQEFFVFPNDGQSQDQQDMDEFQCMRTARERTGFDPMATPTATRRAPDTQGGAVGGAARGALLGTAVGAIAGNTGRGAGAGAAAGGLLGGMRRRDSNRQQQQWAQEETGNYRRDRNNWTRAFTACMESRGYTVG
jgi:uncharacterized protein YcfJ